MKRAVPIIGIFFIVVCVAVLGFFFSRSQEQKIEPKDTTRAQPAPTTQYKQPDGVTFSFSVPPTIPSTLPVYGYNPTGRAESENIADSAAKALGFTATPSAVIRESAYTRRWVEVGGTSLVFSVSGDTTSFLYNQPLPQVALKNDNPELVVRQMVALFNTQPVGVKISNISNGPFDGTLLLESPPAVPLRGYSLQYLLDDYPVGTKEMNISAASIILDANNVVRSANIKPALVATQQTGSVSILTPDQVITSLTEKRGAILDTNKVGSPELGSQPIFSSFRINTVTIFYAPQRDLLLPAFLFSGLGTTKTGETQSATFFLWAFPAGQ